MNSPQRAFAQRHYVAPFLERLGGRVAGGRVLEVGCGHGVGVEVILQCFGATNVQALDVDAEMVALARRRFAAYGPDKVRIDVGDATQIDAPDTSFDAFARATSDARLA